MLKKPKFWDFKKPNFWAYLFLPLTILIEINNILLKLKSKKKFKEIKTICLGNIYIGGTGKTPTTIKLYQLFKDKFNTTTAKKSYSRQLDEQIILENKQKNGGSPLLFLCNCANQRISNRFIFINIIPYTVIEISFVYGK